MILGHLPAGYLVSRLAFSRFGSGSAALRWYLVCGMLGAIAPDTDLIYATLFAREYRHHHTYWTHLPIVWISLLLFSMGLRSLGRRHGFSSCLFIFSLNGLVHMVLDTIAGEIWWFAPFIDESFSFFSGYGGFERWWMNILFSWPFAIEMVIVTSALYRGGRDIRIKINSTGVGRSG